MKIALIVPGGVDRSGTHRVIPCLLWLIERLARKHEVHVFALRGEPRPARYRLAGAAVYLAGARPRAARLLAAIVAEHRRAPFSVLHAVWAHPPGIVAAAAGRILGVPVLLHLTGGDLAADATIGYGLRSRPVGRAALRAAVAGAAAVTVPSQAMEAAAARLGIDADVLTYGVDTEAWKPAVPRPRRPEATARLLHVGSLNAVKDQGTLLRAVRFLADDGVEFELDVAGEDTLHGRVQSEAHALGLDDVVRFRGFLPHAELRPLMDAADLLLVSSRHEADPIVVLEAAIAGVPAAGTRVGHLAAWAPDAAAAVAVGDARALADAAARLLRDDTARLRMAHAAQQRALACDAAATAERTVRIYEEIVDR